MMRPTINEESDCLRKKNLRRRKQCEAAGAAISKGHLLLSHNFFCAAILLKLYCMDSRLLVTNMGLQTSTLILNNLFVDDNDDNK